MFRFFHRNNQPAKRPTQLRTRLQLEGLSERIAPATGILKSALGVVTIEGTATDDTSSVSVSGRNVVITLNSSSVIYPTSVVRSLVFKGLDGNDSFSNSTSLPSLALGGNGNDTLSGGNLVDQLFGGAGDDTLNGNAGNDSLNGELGDDTLNGGIGNDSNLGGSGADDIFGGMGNDFIDGGDGSDDLNGDSGNDTINGSSGDDSVSGGLGNDLVKGGTGNDDLTGDDGNDWLLGEAGDDRLLGGLGIDRVSGGTGSDSSISDSSDSGNDCERREGIQQKDGFAKVEGTLVSVAGDQVTIRTIGGVEVVVTVNDATVIEKDDLHANLADLVIGERAEAKFNPTNNIALKLEGGADDNGGGSGGNGGNNGGNNQGSKVEGTITAVGANSVTIRRLNGTTITVQVASTTKVERNDFHVALSAFKVGDRGEARYDPTTLVATKVEAEGA